VAALAGRHPLSPNDSLMWRIESDPVLRSPVVVVALLDRSPRQQPLRNRLERATRIVPGLGHRLVPPSFGIGRPVWEPVEGIALDHHLRRVRLSGGGVAEVLALAAPDATAPFDPARPPWSLTVVDGLDDGGAAFVLRFHHAISDGVGALRLAAALFDLDRRSSVRNPSGAPDGTTPPVAPTSTAGRSVPARLARVAGHTASQAVATARDPVGTVRGAARLGPSLWRLLQPGPSGASPLPPERGLDRALHAFEVPLADLKAAAATCGGTVNDVLLAGVGGAFRAYQAGHGRDVPTMRVSLPVDRRADGDPAGGNRFTMARLVLPIDDPDPGVRARLAGAEVRLARAEPGLAATDTIAAALDLLPPLAAAKAMGALLRGTEVNVVDLRGLDRPAFVAGARIDRLWAFAPTAGSACSVTLLSHEGRGCVAIAVDRAAVADPDRLVACLVAALDEARAIGTRP
jgi:diacylglycerol O-acyltransferase / wax synthase